MASSLMMCLQANGMETNEDEVNAVMGARPMKGASWEQALACAQHYGMRGILMVPCTVKQLKEWTDQGVPVMIAWNPEGREWSHASVVFDVTESEAGLMVHVADPNIPNPDKFLSEHRQADQSACHGRPGAFMTALGHLVRTGSKGWARAFMEIIIQRTFRGNFTMCGNCSRAGWRISTCKNVLPMTTGR